MSARTALQQITDLVTDAYAVTGTPGASEEAQRLVDAVRHEAAEEQREWARGMTGPHASALQAAVLADADRIDPTPEG